MSQESTQCHQCGGDNRSGANFCVHCGVKLSNTCGQCGKPLAPEANFCDSCGAAAIQSANQNSPSQTAADKISRERPASSAERRHLTVMFVDLVGSTEMSVNLDPEEMRELLAAYQDSCADVVTRFEGHIARYVGDGILIYFGYPTAHEDDAARAVSAGLAITKAVGDVRFDVPSNAVDLRVRIGAASGLVVVGDIGSGTRREEMAVVGETPNLASRLHGLAGPGEMIISETTRKLVEGMFKLEVLDEVTLKGMPDTMQCYRVIAEGGARTRLEAVAASALTPFVGRKEELSLLENRWRQAKEGELRLVYVSGEAGIGKSRLIKSLRDSIKREPNHRLLYFGSPYHQNSAFAPIIDQLRRAFGFVHTDTDHDRIIKLKKTLRELDLTADEIIEPVQTLLSIPIDGRHASETDPSEIRARIVQALLTVVEALCDRSPVFMLVEDAHWFDPSSLDFITNLTRRLGDKQLLLIVTHRPEFSPPVAGSTHVTELPLSRLSRSECIEIMDRVTHGKSLSESIREEVIGKTDGIPLFVEELTKTVLETGVVENREGKLVSIERLPSLAIPDSLRDSLMARLDRLATARDVAQLAAILGRTFSLELLDAVSTLESKALNDALTRLIESGLIYECSRPPDVTYEFKHALVRDAAYESLLKSTRQRFHHRIARTIEERFPDLAEREPELLAQHYTESGLAEQAIRYWLQAGQQAWRRSAVLEAIADIEQGLSLLPELTDEPLAKTLEIDLLLVLGVAVNYSQGPAAQRAYDIYQRARSLCPEDDIERLFPTLWGEWHSYSARGMISRAVELAEELLELAQRSGDDELLLESHHVSWGTYYFEGKIKASLTHAKQGLTLYRPEDHHKLAMVYGGHDPGSCAYFQAAMMFWLLGLFDQSREKLDQGLELTRSLNHRASLVWNLTWSPMVYQMLGEKDLVIALANELRDLSAEGRSGDWSASTEIMLGWAEIDSGQVTTGVAKMEKALTERSSLYARCYYVGLLAAGYLAAGRAGDAVRLLDQAIADIHESSELWWEAELHRLKGVALVQKSDSGAEDVLNEAIRIARSQEAKALELRAATDLARLWIGGHKFEEARQLLNPIYCDFSEGHGCRELIAAKDLLAGIGIG